MGKIIWLASYLRSGNTWLRVFLRNYLLGTDKPVNINKLGGFIACDRTIFDDIVGVEAANLTFDEIEHYRPKVYENLATRNDEPILIKIHDAVTLTDEGYPIVSEQATLKAVYLIRNPLDVAVSLAHFFNTTTGKSIDYMANSDAALNENRNKTSNWLRQRLLSWSEHVKSWIDQTYFPVHVVRYEDMVNKPVETFSSVTEFLGMGEDEARIRKALEFSSFDILNKQEQSEGFREKPPQIESFFRQGKAGSWHNELTDQQCDRIVADHTEVMRRFGYLTENGEIVY
jgi:hypothetical protein